MKIALIRRGYSSSGGAEAYLRRLATGLIAAGHHPVLVTTSEWPLSAWVNDAIRRVDAGGPERFAELARRASGNCDVVFSMERIGRCDIYRAGDGVHRVWQSRRRAFEPIWKPWLRIFNRKNTALLRLEQETFSCEGARWVIANSVMVHDEILANFDYSRDRVAVIPNGYDPPGGDIIGDRAETRALNHIPDDHAMILFAGSGWERKGLRFAVNAVERMSNVTLVVAGKGTWRGPIPENVRLIGPVKKMRDLYAAADVFVAPTIYDPFSNACLEALAAGLPVVTTDANGFSEILGEGIHGSIIRAGDGLALEAALEHWAAQRGNATVRAGCRKLSQEYSEDRNLRSTLDVINRAAGR